MEIKEDIQIGDTGVTLGDLWKLEDITSKCTFTNCTLNAGKVLVDRQKKILYIQLSVHVTVTSNWETVMYLPNYIIPVNVNIADNSAPLANGNWIYHNSNLTYIQGAFTKDNNTPIFGTVLLN